MDRISIIGAGAWGTALAMVARRAGRRVTLWAREPEVIEAVNASHANPLFLPGVALDPAIRATGALAEEADAVVLATPAQFTREVASALATRLGAATPVLIATKGIERGTGALMTEVVRDTLSECPVAVISGPSFAADVARDLPTALTVASADAALARRFAESFTAPRFRAYLSDDVAGVQIGGAVKNVVAIACGIAIGRALGDNARAALLTRGLAEMTRLALAKGGRAETMLGLAGVGDLTLTCNGTQSRNLSLGIALGQGERLADILARRHSIAEGVATAASVVELARRLGVEMPIAQAVDSIVNRGASIEASIEGLLARPVSVEAGWARERSTGPAG